MRAPFSGLVCGPPFSSKRLFVLPPLTLTLLHLCRGTSVTLSLLSPSFSDPPLTRSAPSTAGVTGTSNCPRRCSDIARGDLMHVIVAGASVFAEDTDFTSRSLPSFVHDVIFLPRDRVVGAEAGFPDERSTARLSFSTGSSSLTWMSSAGDFTVDELDEVFSRKPNRRSPATKCSLVDEEAAATILLLAPNFVNRFRQTVNGVLTPSINASLSSDDNSLSSWKSDDVLSLILPAKLLPASLLASSNETFSTGRRDIACSSRSYDEELVEVVPASVNTLAVPLVDVDLARKPHLRLDSWPARAFSQPVSDSAHDDARCSSVDRFAARGEHSDEFLASPRAFDSSLTERAPSSETLESATLESCCLAGTGLSGICFLLITTGGGRRLVGRPAVSNWPFTDLSAICSSLEDNPGGWDFDNFSLNSWILAECTVTYFDFTCDSFGSFRYQLISLFALFFVSLCTFSHRQTHTLSLSLSHTHTHIYSFSLSLSLSSLTFIYRRSLIV